MVQMLRVKGARENNLKNINIDIPREKFVVLTGVSGSGKSSLAFDTIYAEGQRRFVESLSTHAKQFLGQLKKPDVDSIEGLSPSISIQQRVAFGSPRSTVGTSTEIYDHLRVLFAKLGKIYCPSCAKPIHSLSSQQIVDFILKRKNEHIMLLSPVVSDKKGDFSSIIKDFIKAGFLRARIDGEFYELDKAPKLKKNLTHDIEIIIDRLTVNEDNAKRLSESVATALNMGKGIITAVFGENQKEEVVYSELNSCPDCGTSFSELTPGMFSFNSPYGACEMCHGLGSVELLDEDLMVVDEDKSINEGAIPLINIEDVPMIEPNKTILKFLADKYKVKMDIPWRDLPSVQKEIILNGGSQVVFKSTVWVAGKPKVIEKKFEGFRKIFFERFHTTDKTLPKDIIKRYMSPGYCPQCGGKRLKREALSVKVSGYSIIDITEQPIEKLYETFKNITLDSYQQAVGREIIDEMLKRLQFMKDVGLGYLTLARRSNTLGGGEAQRIKLATQIGSGLIGVLYVLDEPTIGLHPRDVNRLLNSLNKLKELGNSVLVVEHDEATICSAEHVVELGPKAGTKGGHLIFEGSLQELMQHKDSQTAKYLRGELKIPIPAKRRPFKKDNSIIITDCSANNLKNVTAVFPLNCFVSVTGVSGSGKSTLIHQTLYKALQLKLTRAKVHPSPFGSIKGYDKIQSIVEIDQSPIGRTPRSNPATYSGTFDLIREWYANLPDAKLRGFKATHFSFNVRGGRCEACSGDGIRKIEMHFLPDVYVPCEVCKGKRYERDILDIKYKGKSISEVLDSTVEEALVDFKNVPAIYEKLQLLNDVGLSYLKLGQSATTLSGGEAQRVKLAAELGQKIKGESIYILDEPTTGLHLADIYVLLEVLQRLVDMGHSVIVIEHNLEVIAANDYVIDLGPDGGDKGGEIVAFGTPEEIMNNSKSATGEYLKKHFSNLKKLRES